MAKRKAPHTQEEYDEYFTRMGLGPEETVDVETLREWLTGKELSARDIGGDWWKFSPTRGRIDALMEAGARRFTAYPELKIEARYVERFRWVTTGRWASKEDYVTSPHLVSSFKAMVYRDWSTPAGKFMPFKAVQEAVAKLFPKL